MNEAKNHIVLICSRLDMPGGIERAIVNTASLFAGNNHPVTLLILDESDKSFYPIHPSVNVQQYPLVFGMTSKGNKLSRKIQFLRDIKKLKAVLKKIKADTVIASEYPFAIVAVMAGAKKISKVYSWEHHHFDWLKKSFFWKFLFNSFYPKLDGIVCLNKTEADHFKQLAPVSILPNFIENKSGKKTSGNTKTILSVGWLIHRKGIDFIIPDGNGKSLARVK
jgi:glycosyltransferase involved in cell wall biosynthesis